MYISFNRFLFSGFSSLWIQLQNGRRNYRQKTFASMHLKILSPSGPCRPQINQTKFTALFATYAMSSNTQLQKKKAKKGKLLTPCDLWIRQHKKGTTKASVRIWLQSSHPYLGRFQFASLSREEQSDPCISKRLLLQVHEISTLAPCWTESRATLQIYIFTGRC